MNDDLEEVLKDLRGVQEWCVKSAAMLTAEKFLAAVEAVEELAVARGAMATMQEERGRQRHYFLQLQGQIKALSSDVERLKALNESLAIRVAGQSDLLTKRAERIAEVDTAPTTG